MSGALLDWIVNGARKATSTFLVATAGALGTAGLDGVLTGGEGVASVSAGVLAAAAAFGFKNTGTRAPAAGGEHRA